MKIALALLFLGLPATSAFSALTDIFKSFGVAPAAKPMATYKIAITGASGMVGSALVKSLKDVEKIQGKSVETIELARGSDWDPETGNVNLAKLEGIDCLVHLAGEGVASGQGPLAVLGRWDEEKKERILSSRTKGTATVVSALQKLTKPPKVLITASAVGYYGYNSGDECFDESSPKGEGFLAEVVDQWEAEAKKCTVSKVICMRFGVMLAKEGGVVAKLLPIFSLGGGGNLGSGRQYFTWLSLRDCVRALEFAMEAPQKLLGTAKSVSVNCCGPLPCTNGDFTTAFAQAIKRPAFIPVPEFVGSLVFGQMGDEMLFGGQRVLPKALEKSGFKFEDNDVSSALNHIFEQ